MARSVLLDVLPEPGRCHGFVTELVLRCAAGDEDALGTLVDLLGTPVHAVLRSRAPAALCEQLAVETFIRVWRHAPTFPSGRPEGAVAWVMGHLTAVLAEVAEPAIA